MKTVLASGLVVLAAWTLAATRTASDSAWLLDGVHWTCAFCAAAWIAWRAARSANGDLRRVRGRFALGLGFLAAGRPPRGNMPPFPASDAQYRSFERLRGLAAAHPGLVRTTMHHSCATRPPAGAEGHASSTNEQGTRTKCRCRSSDCAGRPR